MASEKNPELCLSSEGKNEKEVHNPIWVKASYGSREMFGQWITIVFGSALIFFYKQTVGLDDGLVTLAVVLWSIWNAINDPLMGYLMEKLHMPWEKKTGLRRFPWIIMGAVPFLFAYMSLYYVNPEWSQWGIFAWMLGSLFIYDFFGTMYDVNAVSMFPIKFPGLNERRSAQLWGTILGIVGITLGFLLVIPRISAGVESYRLAAQISVYGGLVLLALMIPGVYENDRMKKINQQRNANPEHVRSLSFVGSAKKAFQNKYFVMKVVFFFGYQAAVALVNASALYVVNFLLDDPGFITLMMAMMLVGALVTVPLWLKLGNKLNDNKKTSILGGIMMIISFIPMMFVTTSIGWLISMFLFGVGLGGQWFMDPPTMGDVFDNIAVNNQGKRDESIYYGYQTFIVRFGEAFKAVAIIIAHFITGLPEGVETRAELAAVVPDIALPLFGIRIHTALIPMILVIITTVLFWKYYTLTPEKVAANKKKLAEMGV